MTYFTDGLDHLSGMDLPDLLDCALELGDTQEEQDRFWMCCGFIAANKRGKSIGQLRRYSLAGNRKKAKALIQTWKDAL